MLSYELNLARSALVLLDIQEDFLQARGPLEKLGLRRLDKEERKTLLFNCGRLLEQARKTGRPVIHVQTVFRPDLADCFFPPKWLDSLNSSSPVLVDGSPGAAVPLEIAPEASDFRIQKKGLCAFQFTHSERLLRSLSVDTCILCGFCGVAGSIDETVRMAGLLGFDAAIASDAAFPVHSPHLETLTNQAAIKDTEGMIRLMKEAGPFRKREPELKPALILIAMNNDGNHPLGSKYKYTITAHGPGITEEQRQVYVRNNNRLIEAMTRKGFPVIHSQTAVRLDRADDAHANQGFRNRQPERDRKFPPGVGYMIEDTWGSEILEGVKLPKGYYRVFKKGNSSFGLTHLQRLLRNLEVNLCILTGDSTTGCVSDTVREGVGLGYRVIVVSDATSRANLPYHQVLANRAEVMSTEEALAMLETLPPIAESQPEGIDQIGVSAV